MKSLWTMFLELIMYKIQLYMKKTMKIITGLMTLLPLPMNTKIMILEEPTVVYITERVRHVSAPKTCKIILIIL